MAASLSLDLRKRAVMAAGRGLSRRQLADFAKLVELFDEHGVSFVSVT